MERNDRYAVEKTVANKLLKSIAFCWKQTKTERREEIKNLRAFFALKVFSLSAYANSFNTNRIFSYVLIVLGINGKRSTFST